MLCDLTCGRGGAPQLAVPQFPGLRNSNCRATSESLECVISWCRVHRQGLGDRASHLCCGRDVDDHTSGARARWSAHRFRQDPTLRGPCESLVRVQGGLRGMRDLGRDEARGPRARGAHRGAGQVSRT